MTKTKNPKLLLPHLLGHNFAEKNGVWKTLRYEIKCPTTICTM